MTPQPVEDAAETADAEEAADTAGAVDAVVDDLFPVDVQFQLLVDAETDEIHVKTRDWHGLPPTLLSETHPNRFETVLDELRAEFQFTDASYARGRLTIGPDTADWKYTTQSTERTTATPPDWNQW